LNHFGDHQLLRQEVLDAPTAGLASNVISSVLDLVGQVVVHFKSFFDDSE
jgi:hypothetical protein